VAFPAVGLLIGGAWAGAGWLGSLAFGSVPAAAVVLLVDLVLTGGLHLDGLADAADGLASRRPREEAMAIMREGPMGPVGGATLVVAVLLRFSFLACLLRLGDLGGLAVAPVAGRAGMVWLLWRHPVASDASLASTLHRAATAGTVILVGAIAGLAAWVLAGPGGAGILGLAGVLAEASGWFWRRRLGGVVGDVVGAVGVTCETAAVAVLCAGRG
jgi:adenosylcobinamide-GDP ribazoletransferase